MENKGPNTRVTLNHPYEVKEGDTMKKCERWRAKAPIKPLGKYLIGNLLNCSNHHIYGYLNRKGPGMMKKCGDGEQRSNKKFGKYLIESLGMLISITRNLLNCSNHHQYMET